MTPRGASATRTGELLLEVRLTPRAAFDRIDGVGTLANQRRVLLARVRAVPEDGRANEALCRLIAEAFGLPKSAVTIVSGESARLKRLRLTGDPVKLAATLDGLASSSVRAAGR